MAEASVIQEVMQAISTVGFPVVACAAIFYTHHQTISELTVTLNKIDAILQVMVTNINDIQDYIKSKEA